MGVMIRRRSPFLHIWIPGLSTKPENTRIPIGVTATERKANWQQAGFLISKRQLDAANRAAGLPVAAPAPAEGVTFRTYAAQYAQNVLPGHRGAYREKSMLPRLVAAFGDLLLTTPPFEWHDAVITWRTRRLATPTVVKRYGGKKGKAHTFPKPTPATVNREVGLLRQILGCAVRDRKIAVSPLARFRALTIHPVESRLTTPDEERRILAALAVDDRAIYIMACDALVRLGDCLDLKRSEDRGHELYIRYPKNGEPLTVPVSSRLRAALDAVPVDPIAPQWYFPRRRGAATEQDRNRSYAKALQRACESATPPVPYGRNHGGVTFHWATRATGATRMIRAGGSSVIKDVAAIGGWKNVNVLIEIYQKSSSEDRRAVVELAAPAPAPPPPPSTKATRRAASRLRQVK